MISDDLASRKEYLFSHNFAQREKKSQQHVIRDVYALVHVLQVHMGLT